MVRIFRGGIAAVAWLLSSSWTAAETLPLDLSGGAEPGLRGCFANLEPGPREVDGILFAVGGGRVRVRPGGNWRAGFPPEACQSIHFLHYTEHSGDPAGAYELVFADGERVEVPLRCGLNIQDWWKPGPLPVATQVHGDALMNGDQQQPIGFWRFSVRNPRPDVQLAGLEVQNTHNLAVINLIAVTLSDTASDKIGGVPVWVPGKDEEQFLLAILGQPDTVAGKAQACEQLRYAGSAASVPALAALLGDEQLSHAARMVLDAMAYPEAGAALREALGTAPGDAKAGIVESLGTRRDREAVPLLTPLLRGENPKLAMSVALALGKIGGPAAIEALQSLLADNPPENVKTVALDGLLRCAETLSGEDSQSAHALYGEILSKWGQGNVRIAAEAGLIRTAGADAGELAASALLSEDPALWAAALPAVRGIEGPAATQAFAALTGRVPRGVLPGLAEALAQRGSPEASRAVAGLVDDADPAVRAAAIEALSVIGDGSAVPALVNAATHGEEPDRAAAVRALARLSAPDATAALLRQLGKAGPAEAAAVAGVLGQRRDKAARPALRRALRVGKDPGFRMAAALALAEVGTARDAKRLCRFAERADDADASAEALRALGQMAATRALVRLGERLDVPPRLVRSILANLRKDDPGLRCTMLAVCGELRHPQLLQALGKATSDATPEVRDAAIRALADCGDPGALAYLTPLLETASDPMHRALVFRGIARLASDADKVEEPVREDALRRALAARHARTEDVRLLLGAAGTCHTAGALKCVQEHLANDDVVTEAVIAWVQIAQSLVKADPEAIHDAAERVLARAREAGLSQEVQQPILEVLRASAATPVSGDRVRFERVTIDPQFRSEGVAVADVNHDGCNDVIAGDVWYAAPAWQVREVRPAQTYDPNNGYSQCFANFAMDVDGDGWPDSIVVGFPGAPALWYRNPGEAPGHWEARPLAPSACGETPIFGDLLGDGRPVPVFAMNRRITWFRPRSDLNLDWQAFPVTQELPEFSQFGHGLGMGEVNGDGRTDLLSTVGWWEAPEDRSRADWAFHKASFGPACANMLVYDVDGDGDNDVITSSAHEHGIWWFEQRQENGETQFEQHEIYKGISQTHALILADINNDGLPDLVTGKRYYAHNGHDPGAHEPATLCWLELQRTALAGKCEFKFHEIDNDSGVGTQFEVCDLDGDGLLDVVTSNKKGVHAFLQRRNK